MTATVDLDQKSFFIMGSRHAPSRIGEAAKSVPRESIPVVVKKVHILGVDRILTAL